MQEHHARSLHWDLRLERDGVLVSWAVPKGIPDDPKRNHLAVHVEDHPLGYIDFAGEIPAGSYGAGEVQIWDAGSYECHKFRDDEVIVTFHGERLEGKYALFQTKGKNWMIHRMDPPRQSEREPMPERLVPMLASAGRLPAPTKRTGRFEIKWDGVRAITYWRPGELRIESRNLNDVSARYPELRALGPQLGSREAVLDGEIVAFDEQGRPSFERLQRRMHVTSASAIRRLASEQPVSYLIFDLLYLDGRTTMELPYRERRALLEELGLQGPAWQTPRYHAGEGRELLAAAAEQQPGGRRRQAPGLALPPGQAHGRVAEDQARQPSGARDRRLAAGQGRAGGTARGAARGLLRARRGWSAGPALRADASARALTRRSSSVWAGSWRARANSSPFSGTQPPRGARFVEPELVAEIEFRQWTGDRILRHSSYKGLREDKPRGAVRLEENR